MPITYTLKKNYLREGSREYYPQVKLSGSADINAIAQRMIEQGSTITLEDIRAVLTSLNKACLSIVLEGRRVNLGELVDIYPRMQGTFNSLSDEYSSLRHTIGANASVSRRFLYAVAKQATVEKEKASVPRPEPLDFTDGASKVVNVAYTTGRYATLEGENLSVNESRNDEGIFFIDAGTGATTRVTEIIENAPKKLVFIIPDIVGSHRVAVRKRFGNSNNLREGRLEATLTDDQAAAA